MKKSQVGIEFLYFVGVGIVILLIYLSLSSSYFSFTSSRKDSLTAKNLLENIRNEINLAGRVENGYSRIIKLPNDINGKNYNINIAGRELSIEFPINENTYARILITKVNLVGTLAPGKNLLITKKDNQVFVTVQ
jgi:hypothetical protein